LHVETRFTQFYSWAAYLTFEPLYFELYNQNIKWSRYEDNGDIHMWISGDRAGRALDFTTTTVENMQTFERSLVEFLLDDTNTYELLPHLDDQTEFDFDADYEVEQEDLHWNYSFEP
jgi:hypothetical protein